ncbi:MAG: hypothetical protein II039_06295 [Treponema sp.]|nr:hypothetical protein [Treponema sp.]
MISSNKMADIHCPSCGAPAAYDIIKRLYRCSYCDGSVTIREAIEQKRGFRKLHQEKLQESVSSYDLEHAECTGCGAEIVFEKGEALSKCEFCGRALVRKEYLKTGNMPELVIPFELTEDEAKERLVAWKKANWWKAEAKALTPEVVEKLKGYYLPYELVRGPVDCIMSKEEDNHVYHMSGFVNDEFINASDRLDNLLLDAMEPFDVSSLTEFDFGYIAGHRVKIADLNKEGLVWKIKSEVSSYYNSFARKTMKTRLASAGCKDTSELLRMPVLLPVYYISSGDVCLAVNGQTGKVSVREIKQRFFHLMPWWLKAIVATLLIGLLAFVALSLIFKDIVTGSGLAIMLSGLFFLITLVHYHNEYGKRELKIERDSRYFVSKGGPFRRKGKRLVQDIKPLVRKFVKPVGYVDIPKRGRAWCEFKFNFARKIVFAVFACIAFVSLTVIIALFLNKFNFRNLNFQASAVWFCLSVPISIILFIKYVTSLKDMAADIYLLLENGKKKRYVPEDSKNKHKKEWEGMKDDLKELLIGAITPPGLFLTLFILLIFFGICWCTAFGWMEFGQGN